MELQREKNNQNAFEHFGKGRPFSTGYQDL
jgi:hypothetical protein